MEDYFNKVLKSHLSLPESFSISHDPSENKFIIIPNKQSKLFLLLRSNEKLRTQFKQTIISAIHTLIPNSRNVSVEIVRDKMTINYDAIGIQDIGNKGEIGLYANIASRLPEEEISNLCLLDENFRKICKNNLFWREVIKNKFPEYLVDLRHEINWREIYKGLEFYENLKRIDEEYERMMKIYKEKIRGTNIKPKRPQRSDVYNWGKFVNNYMKTVRYLVFNRIVELSNKDVQDIIYHTTYYNNGSSFDMIYYLLDTHELSDNTLSSIFEEIFLSNNVNLVTGAYKIYEKLKKDYIIKGNFQENLDLIIYDNHASNLNPELFVFLTEKLGEKFTPDYLLDIYERADAENDSLKDKILELLPRNFESYKNKIVSTLRIMLPDASYKMDEIKKLFTHFRNVFTSDDMGEILEELQKMKKRAINSHTRYEIDEYEQLIDFFKNR